METEADFFGMASLINFIKNYQFVSRIQLKDFFIEQVKEAKVLGTIISDTLSWNANCARLITKCNMRLQQDILSESAFYTKR